MPWDLTVQKRVALEASTRRPSTASTPRSSSSRASRSPSGRSESQSSPNSGTALSGTGGPVTVLPRAYVTARVERQSAQRARRTSGRDKLECALRERTGRARTDPDPQHPGTVNRNVVGQRLDRSVAFLLRLDDHPVAVAVPGERDRADPEVLGQRQVERSVVPQRRRGGLGNLDRVSRAAQDLVEQLVNPF